MRAQGLRAVRPDVDDQAGAVGTEVGEDAVVLVGEADDLAPAEAGAELGHRVARRRRRDVPLDGRRQRREPVLEDDDLVGALGDLGRAARAGRVQRALVGRRQERAGLPVGGDGHPLPQQRVPAQLRARGHRREVPGVGRVAGDGSAVEVEDLPAVGQATTRPDHGPDAISRGDHRANPVPERREPPAVEAGGSRAL